MNYSRKRLCKVLDERNSQRILETKQIFCRDINTEADENLVFLDETGFNLHLTKNYDYSQINTKCFITVPANKNKNISLLCAVKKSGVIAFAIKEGSFDRASLFALVQKNT
ncbi:hypothetical protein CDIK_2529 [Cucumispora dikerogammari]|nr:hypothetical protein CDIK_2529 [Cucumispora dikerogammari]